MSSVLAPSTTCPPGAPHAATARSTPFRKLARSVLRLSLPRFLAIGCVGLATDALVFSACSAAGGSDAPSRIVSLGLATAVTWQLNRRFTFAGSGRRTHAEAARYAGVALCAQGFNLAIFLLLRSLAPALPALAAIGISAVLAASFSFTGQSLLTFRARLAGIAPTISGIRP